MRHVLLLAALASASVYGEASARSEPDVMSPRPQTPVIEDEFGPTVSSADLGRLRAGDGKTVYQAVTEQTLAATNSGNVVSGTTIGSGAVTFGPNALSGFSGVGNFVVNSGHNNNLQGAITVNVLITPGK